MIWVMCLLMGAPEPLVEPLWNYHLKSLHSNISSQNFYEAKRDLAFLRRSDETTYETKKFDLTAAWIAAQEENWGSAYDLNKVTDINVPEQVLDKAVSLTKLGRYEEALKLLQTSKRRFQGDLKWSSYALRATCHQQLGQMDKAILYYRKLTHKNAPTQHRESAYSTLIGHYYETGKVKRARSLSEKVQKAWPVSDVALLSLGLQERFEKETYLKRSGTIERHAKVAYQNRDFERARTYYEALKTFRKKAAKARYNLALIHVKEGNAEEALKAFEAEVENLRGTDYQGRALFQLGRMHFHKGNDDEVSRIAKAYWNQKKDHKWRREGMRLWVLSQRRMGDREAYARLEQRLRVDKSPRWLWRHYHRNGLIWAMQDGRGDDAERHLKAYRKQGIRGEARLEADLWAGMLAWERGNADGASDAWLRVLEKDPNHYFGLMARELMAQLPKRPLPPKWENAPMKSLKRYYYQAQDETTRAMVGQKLYQTFLKMRPGFNFPIQDYDASLAEIGRFDWAARKLTSSRKNRLAWHYSKARLYRLARDVKSSIHHAEIVVNSYPKWVPYELMPQQLQELCFPTGFANHVQEATAQKAVDPFLLWAIIREESHFDPSIKSWASARGLMQFIPATAEDMAKRAEIDNFEQAMLYQPQTAVTLGATYVSYLLDAFDGQAMHAVAAYNAGETATHRWREFSQTSNSLGFVWDVSYKQTRRYCQKVMRAYYHYRRIYGKTPDVLALPVQVAHFHPPES